MAKPSTAASFYFVWNLFEQRPSRKTFDTRKEANGWAKSQARQNPGVEYFVAKALSVVVSSETDDSEPTELT